MTETVQDFLNRGGSIDKIEFGVSNLDASTGLTKVKHSQIKKSGKKGAKIGGGRHPNIIGLIINND